MTYIEGVSIRSIYKRRDAAEMELGCQSAGHQTACQPKTTKGYKIAAASVQQTDPGLAEPTVDLPSLHAHPSDISCDMTRVINATRPSPFLPLFCSGILLLEQSEME